MKLPHLLYKMILLSSILCLLLSVSLSAADTTVGLSNFSRDLVYEDGMFSDVPSGQWYSQNVAEAYEYGLMKGTGDGEFLPGGSISIIETVVTACRLHNIYNGGTHVFEVTTPWEKPYIDYAVKNGLIGADEYEDYSAKATRAQFAAILASALPGEALPAINDIKAGAIHDVPAMKAYAEDVYLLYNAGILAGSDDYGTFYADRPISRAEVAAILTRMANPELRRNVSLKIYDPYPPEKIEIEESLYYRKDFLYITVGQKVQLDVKFTPNNAHSGIEWISSDPSIISVDSYGAVRSLRAGNVTLTAKTYNGVTDTIPVTVVDVANPLTFELTEDGTGYRIVACSPQVYTVNIPATHEGLPVTEIADQAFHECRYLSWFTVDADHSVFYAEDGVIFTDIPYKTLVRFPNAYCEGDGYTVPSGTVHIADYAFSSMYHSDLKAINISEGVLTLGDCVFANFNAGGKLIVIPDSLESVGKTITYNKVDMPSFVYSDTNNIFYQYGNENALNHDTVRFTEYYANTLESYVPPMLPIEEWIPFTGDIQFVDQPQLDYYSFHYNQWEETYTLSSYQDAFDGEVRLQLDSVWNSILPDVNGNIEFSFLEQTGLYGAGYTKGSAVLRGYDIYGNLVAMQKINGNFAFAFPGAVNIGIENGTNTTITIVPTEPIYICKTGDFYIDFDQWHQLPNGKRTTWIVLCSPFSNLRAMQSSARASIGYKQLIAGTGMGGTRSTITEYYQMYKLETTNDDYSQYQENSIYRVSGYEALYEDSEVSVLTNGSVDIRNPNYIDQLVSCYYSVKENYLGVYAPKINLPQKFFILIDGIQPQKTSNRSSVFIHLNQEVFDNDQFAKYAVIHEMIHGFDACMYYQHGGTTTVREAFNEGRAEYIGKAIAQRIGIVNDYMNYPENYDWSFITEEQRNDFLSYYRTVDMHEGIRAYAVGYYFNKYLCDTYGENVLMRIFDNMLNNRIYWDVSEIKSSTVKMFKHYFEAATDENVFQNFVRDVIEG